MKKLLFFFLLIIFCTVFSNRLVAQNPFVTTWQTTNDTISIPVVDTLVYNYDVVWTNLTTQTLVGDSSGITGEFTIPGLSSGDLYEISISGNFPAILFNNGTEKDKIQTIEQWGDIQWTTMYLAFYGCSNLTSNATDAPNLQATSNLLGMFAGASSFNSDLNNWDVSNITNMYGTFFNATSFNGNISNWNVGNVTTTYFMFNGASSFNQDISNWNVSSVTDMSYMFQNATSFNQNLNNWNVGNVTTMYRMFDGASVFNGNISTWNVSQVTNMYLMFRNAFNFNSDLSNWNVSSVTNMGFMFTNATSFNSDLSNWYTGNVTNMSSMFSGATSFNSDIRYWYTINVTNMSNMFSGATSFDHSLGNWNISSVTNMAGMLDNSGLSKINYDATLKGWESFYSTPLGITLGAAGLFYCNSADSRQILTGTSYSWIINGDVLECDPFITTWQTTDGAITIPTDGINKTYFYDITWTNLTTGAINSAFGLTGDYTITGLSNDLYEISISGDFPQIYFLNSTFDNRSKIQTIEQWGDIEWTDFTYSFYNCVNLISNATDSPLLINVTDLSSMFSGATSFTGDLSNWDVSNITDMNRMFYNNYVFNSNLNSWNVSRVTNMRSMFFNDSSFVSSDLSTWNVGWVTDMSSMFFGATSFNGNLNSWDVSSVNFMTRMFSGATSFNSDLSNWSVSNVTTMSGMFNNASTFNSDLSNWNVGSVIYMETMFAGASSFNGDLSTWDVRNVIEMRRMFDGATSFNSDISDWDVVKVRQMGGMFWNATSFNQNLGNWDISSIEPFEVEGSPPLGIDSLFTNSAISTLNYDSTLIGWATLSAGETEIPLNLNLGAQNVSYCFSNDERSLLINNYGWTFYDNGPACTIPATQASNIVFSDIAHLQMNLGWTNGDGANRLVLAKENTAVNASPVNLTSYVANAAFGSGDEIGTGNYVVYNGGGNGFTITGLNEGTIYHFQVFEYNGENGLEVYNTSTATGNPASEETLATPVITSFMPTTAAEKDTVSIQGGNFTDASVVSFGGIDATSFTVVSDTVITAIVGAGASGDVLVTTPGGTATLAGFVFIPAPIIDTFSPTTAAEDDTVTINGSNFIDASLVSFGGTEATSFTVVSDTEITAIVGAGNSGDVLVTTPGGTATQTGFGFIPAPIIDTFSPTTAAKDDTILINGSNFTNASLVSFGGTESASFTVVSDTEITAIVGAGDSGDVLVTTPGGTATQTGFGFIPAPIIDTFSPTIAAKDDTVIINGSNFTDASMVSLGGTEATSFTVVSDTEITAIVGTGTSGEVLVTTPGGTATQAGFEFIPAPVIDAFFPSTATENETVTISGANFTDASLVSFGGTETVFEVVSDTVITAIIGTGSSGEVLVTTLGGTATLEGFTFIKSEIAVFFSDGNLITHNQSEAVDLGTAFPDETLERQFQIENRGTADLVVSNITSSNATFEVLNIPDVISPGASAQFSLQFNPTDLGIYNSDISISNNSVNSPEFSFKVSAEFTDLNIIDNDTDSIVISNQDVNLGTTFINQNIDRNFVIENRSLNSTIDILRIIVDDPVFQIIDAPLTVPPLSSEEFTVRLNATAVGEYSGIVTIMTTTNDFSFQVAGTVLPEASTEIKIYNVVTPNGDGRHDFLQIENMTEYPNNKVSIFNRWGNKVFEIDNYDNSSHIFEGISNSGEELLSGNYYYVIDKGNGDKRISGFLIIKR
ncbi:BspA family leucine-rich repeat surface protein [Marivirga sp.]|uniref:BspA family leucine-rich repeat surface protein n=1 Tax=Marivirga sp. TaxID=2018662 RepID=UPI0025D15C28|nr:BspA family leucine-rich repeat surface protein [Marivirga sp.]